SVGAIRIGSSGVTVFISMLNFFLASSGVTALNQGGWQTCFQLVTSSSQFHYEEHYVWLRQSTIIDMRAFKF
ncbi:hypothetical protein Pfo_001460, partial [Paulownia fortunei]